jgi:hypothetical protein
VSSGDKAYQETANLECIPVDSQYAPTNAQGALISIPKARNLRAAKPLADAQQVPDDLKLPSYSTPVPVDDLGCIENDNEGASEDYQNTRHR